MIAKLFVVRRGEMGKGLFAKCLIPKGTIICFECHKCKKLSPQRVNKLPKDEIKKLLNHGYRKKDGSILMPCDETKYLNHSCNANILDSFKGFDIVVRYIKKDEEATFDYRIFYDGSQEDFSCNCKEKNCCGIVRCRHPISPELRRFWIGKIDSALKNTKKVPQPLKKHLLVSNRRYAKYFNQRL